MDFFHFIFTQVADFGDNMFHLWNKICSSHEKQNCSLIKVNITEQKNAFTSVQYCEVQFTTLK